MFFAAENLNDIFDCFTFTLSYGSVKDRLSLNGRTSEQTRGRASEGTNERGNERTNEPTSDRKSERKNERNERTNEERTNE